MEAERISSPRALKYQRDLAQISNCPPPVVAPIDVECYRFVFSDINDTRNFLPPAKRNPSRRFENDEKCCSGHAISLFSVQTDAKHFYKRLAINFPNIRKVLGTHLAAGAVEQSHGLATPIRDDSHFDLFEAAGVEWTKSFQIVEALTS